MYLDNPMSVAYDAAKAAHFGEHPLGQSILGTVDSITAMSVEGDARLLRQPSTARRTSSSPSRARRTGMTSSAWPANIAPPGKAGPPAARPSRPGGPGPSRPSSAPRTTSRPSSGSPTPRALEDDDRFAAQLLATVLGDHTGSRLYWELVDPGHADGAEVSYQDYNRAGAFYTFLSCEPGETRANLERIVDAYGRMMAEGADRSRN